MHVSTTTLPNFLAKYSHAQKQIAFSYYEHEVKTPLYKKKKGLRPRLYLRGIFRPFVDFIMELINIKNYRIRQTTLKPINYYMRANYHMQSNKQW